MFEKTKKKRKKILKYLQNSSKTLNGFYLKTIEIVRKV